MLSRNHRLVSSRDFARIFRQGRRLSTPHLHVFYQPRKKAANLDQNFSRFGFLVSKKQAVKIAARNRLKRILRSEVEVALPRVAPGFDVIIQARSSILAAAPSAVRKELLHVLQKSKII